MRKKNLIGLLSLLAIAVAPSLASAQQTDQQRDQERRGQETQRDFVRAQDTQALPRFIATEMAVANHCEIQLAQFAAEQTQNQQVKQYAEKLIQDHKQLNSELVKLFPEIGQMEFMNAQSNANQAEGNQNATQNRNNRGQTGGQDNVAPQRGETIAQTQRPRMRDNSVLGSITNVCTDAANIKLEMSKEMLSKYQGQNFDMAFVGQQLAAHMSMVAKLQAINQSSLELENLAPVLQKAEQTTTQHLEQAKQLTSQLETSGR